MVPLASCSMLQIEISKSSPQEAFAMSIVWFAKAGR